MDLRQSHAFILAFIVLFGGQVHAQAEEAAVEGSLNEGNVLSYQR